MGFDPIWSMRIRTFPMSAEVGDTDNSTVNYYSKFIGLKIK